MAAGEYGCCCCWCENKGLTGGEWCCVAVLGNCGLVVVDWWQQGKSAVAWGGVG